MLQSPTKKHDHASESPAEYTQQTFADGVQMCLIRRLRSAVALVLRLVSVKLNFDEEKCFFFAIGLQKTCTTLGRQSSVLVMNGV